MGREFLAQWIVIYSRESIGVVALVVNSSLFLRAIDALMRCNPVECNALLTCSMEIGDNFLGKVERHSAGLEDCPI